MSIFTENKDITKCHVNNKDVSGILSEQLTQHVSERVKLYEAGMKESASPTHPRNHKSNNNIRHVVPVGLIIVLFTLYLTTAAFQSKYIVREQESDKPKDAIHTDKRQDLAALEAAKRIKILEKLLEYEDLCTELEVFTKDLRWINDACNKDDPLKEFKTGSRQSPEASVDMISSDVIKDGLEKTKSISENVAVKNTHSDVEKENYKSNNSNNNINTNTNSNSNNKKEQSIPKKTNTAEPIIYLFALVFIYLLLKAASDINQHYKLKNKGDKRLRRCSLQSYAQTHKQDRRASKGSPKKPPCRDLTLEMRSKSVDRFSDIATKKSEILANLRKYTSFDEHKRLVNMQCGTFVLPQQTTWETQCDKEILVTLKETIAPKASSRRCSVPISLNISRQKLNALPIMPLSSMARRTSLSGIHVVMEPHMSGLQVADHGQNAHTHEVKKRVRMINRH